MSYRALLALAILGLLAFHVPASTLVDNRWLLPGPYSAAAREDFQGTLALTETAMKTVPSDFAPAQVLGKNPRIFPAARFSFFTQNGDLVPIAQDVLRYGSTPQGASYWDVIVQPGKVWSEPGEDGWSRASFPFTLVHSLEGETHNGIALFAYKNGKVSNLHFQITQQTAPFYIPKEFTASGSVPMKFERMPSVDLPMLRQKYRAECVARIPIGSWDDLVAQVGADKLAHFDSAIPGKEILLSGVFFIRC